MTDNKEFHDTVQATQKHAQEATQDFSADLATLRDDIAKLTGTVSQLLRNRASSATDQAYGSFAQARDQLSERASGVREQVGSLGADVETKIERNPLTAVLIAAVAGLVLGLFSRAL